MTAQPFVYRGGLTKQRADEAAPSLFIFQAKAAEVLKWAFIDRLSPDNKKGTQRAVNDRKVKDVQKFFAADARNVIPTAVVVALKAGASVTIADGVTADTEPKLATITINCDIPDPDTRESADYPGVVIDGQHRLSGMEKQGSDLIVNVVALLDASQEEIAFQFLVINNKASKVDKKHLTNLALDYKEAELNDRLKVSAGLGISQGAMTVLDAAAFDDRSPFYQIVAIPAFKDKIVVPNAIEIAFAFVAASAPADLEDDDKVWLFLFIWKEVKEAWAEQYPSLWQEGSRLLSKVGLICFTQYIMTTMNSVATLLDAPPDYRDEAVVRDLVGKIVARFAPEFFLSEWKRKELDTKTGREILLEAIYKVAANMRYNPKQWYQGVQLIEASSVE